MEKLEAAVYMGGVLFGVAWNPADVCEILRRDGHLDEK